MAEKNILSQLENIKKAIEEEEKISPELRSAILFMIERIEEANLLDIERSHEARISKLEKGLNWLELPVGELKSVIKKSATGSGSPPIETTVRIRLKGQRPDDECLLELPVDKEHLKVIHQAKERGGTVWVRFTVSNDDKSLEGGTLVVRDILE